jgi:hypothetical protein
VPVVSGQWDQTRLAFDTQRSKFGVGAEQPSNWFFL